MGNELFHAVRQAKLIAAFRNLADSPKNWKTYLIHADSLAVGQEDEIYVEPPSRTRP
jgi:hypothetical protein